MEYVERMKAQKADKLFPRLLGIATGLGARAGSWFIESVVIPLKMDTF